MQPPHHRPHHHANTQSHRHLQYPHISDPRVATNSRFTTFKATFSSTPFSLTRWQNTIEVPLTLGRGRSRGGPIDITVRAQGGAQDRHGYYFTVGVATGDAGRINKRKLSHFLANYVAR